MFQRATALVLLSQTGVLGFTLQTRHLSPGASCPWNALPFELVRRPSPRLFSTSAPEIPISSVTDKDDDEEEEEKEKEADEATLEEEEGLDHAKLIAAIDETPVGELDRDQIYCIRDLMAYFVVGESAEEEESYNPDESSAPLVENLLFRLLDEWHAAIENDDFDERRALILEPTLDDFIMTMKAFQRDALVYSKSRQKDARGKEAVDRVEKLLEILRDLWRDAGIESLKPNQPVLEIVISVLTSSRDRGMDRRVRALLQSMDDYGLEPSCEMYKTVIFSLARSRDRNAAMQAETILRKAAEKFPPRVDLVTGLPSGVSVETFNKVLVSWAKSGLEYGPERAEQLMVFMDDLDNKCGGHGLVKPNLSSFTTLIDAYAQQGGWDDVSHSERIFNRVLDHYMEGILEEEPNIASWTIVMSAWSRLAKKNRRGAEERADKLLKRLENLYDEGRVSFPPDAIAYITCMNAWAFSKNPIGPTQAALILDEMHERYMDGDDSMRPSARSIQLVLESWVKIGGEEAMEQAEIVLDRYEDHIESLGGSEDGSDKASEAISDIYRCMLFGWSACDPERAQDYLLDMVDRKMKLDSACFDKIIEAETRRLPEDPAAMKRIHDVFLVLDKCQQAGEVLPNERVYTSYIRAMTKAHEANLAEKASALLLSMNRLYEEGNSGIKPTIFTMNAVLNSCAETVHMEDALPMEAFKVALRLFNSLRAQRDALDHVSFGNMLRCANLLPNGPNKKKFIVATFQLCCERGLVNAFVVRDLQGSASEELWREILQWPQGEVDMNWLPLSWSATITEKNNHKSNNKGQGRGDKKLYQRRRFDS